jgi:hypothetical protein
MQVEAHFYIYIIYIYRNNINILYQCTHRKIAGGELDVGFLALKGLAILITQSKTLCTFFLYFDWLFLDENQIR